MLSGRPGHDRATLDAIRAGLGNDKIRIDGGWVYKGEDGYGNLVALRLEDMRIGFIRKSTW